MELFRIQAINVAHHVDYECASGLADLKLKLMFRNGIATRKRLL